MCKGKGKLKTYYRGQKDYVKCEMCNGTGEVSETGEVEQTNEQWFCSLSTEEKAKWLGDNFGYVAYKGSGGKPKRVQEDLVEYWQEWLKQPHG